MRAIGPKFIFISSGKILLLWQYDQGVRKKYFRLPSIIGFMIVGVISGPSLFNILSERFMITFSSITEIALDFVAVTIGMELKFSTLKRYGKGINLIILSESFLAFIITTCSLFLLTKDFPLSPLFVATVPASAPAKTVADSGIQGAGEPYENTVFRPRVR